MDKPILVVDDVKLDRELLCAQLQDMGYQAVGVESGLDALRLDPEAHSAVLADVVMPHLDGEALLAVTREVMHSEVPFVYVTGTDPEPLLPGAMKYHAEFLAKPVSPAALAEVLLPLVGPPHA